MNLRDLEYIRTVSEEGSITRAAERLHIAQPSLSQCIARVEVRLGVPVFVRTNTGITLTCAGEIFLEMADKIAKSWRDMENAISELNGMQSGRLAVGVPTLLACQIMPRIYSAYARKYPNIDLVLYEEDSRTLVPSLQKGKIDLAIMALPLWADLEYEVIMSCEMVLCAPPGHSLLKHTEPDSVVDLTKLADQPFIRARPHQKIRFIADSILKRAEIGVKTVLMTSSSETAMFLSAHGLGFAILPEFSLRYYRPILPVRYYRLDPRHGADWTIVVARAKNDYLPRAAKLFMEEARLACEEL